MAEVPKYHHWPAHVFLSIAERIAELGEENVRSVRFYPPRGSSFAGSFQINHVGPVAQSHESGHEENCDPEVDEDCFNFTQTCPPNCD